MALTSCLVLAGPGAAGPERLRLQYHCGLQTAAEGGAPAVAAVSARSGSAVSRTLVRRNSVPIADSISPTKCLAIGPGIAREQPVEARSDLPAEVRSNAHSRTNAARYQAQRGRYQPRATAEEAAKSSQPARPTRHDTALMLRIGLLLGLGYVVFLMFWIWATRLRPRRTRSGRGI